MDESEMHYAKLKKSDSRGYYVILFIWHSRKRQTIRIKNR